MAIPEWHTTSTLGLSDIDLQSWPPRFPDIIWCNFFLWGNMRAMFCPTVGLWPRWAQTQDISSFSWRCQLGKSVRWIQLSSWCCPIQLMEYTYNICNNIEKLYNSVSILHIKNRYTETSSKLNTVFWQSIANLLRVVVRDCVHNSVLRFSRKNVLYCQFHLIFEII